MKIYWSNYFAFDGDKFFHFGGFLDLFIDERFEFLIVGDLEEAKNEFIAFKFRRFQDFEEEFLDH